MRSTMAGVSTSTVLSAQNVTADNVLRWCFWYGGGYQLGQGRTCEQRTSEWWASITRLKYSLFPVRMWPNILFLSVTYHIFIFPPRNSSQAKSLLETHMRNSNLCTNLPLTWLHDSCQTSSCAHASQVKILPPHTPFPILPCHFCSLLLASQLKNICFPLSKNNKSPMVKYSAL